ncbi:hypothetical protein NL108_008229 [Boleophthalmus pectinirostris]|nr:hypothetical protein NL108_008229 [Boleophthalmus pectinirostris]
MFHSGNHYESSPVSRCRNITHIFEYTPHKMSATGLAQMQRRQLRTPLQKETRKNRNVTEKVTNVGQRSTGDKIALILFYTALYTDNTGTKEIDTHCKNVRVKRASIHNIF